MIKRTGYIHSIQPIITKLIAFYSKHFRENSADNYDANSIIELA